MAVASRSAVPGPRSPLPWAFLLAVGSFLGALVYFFAVLARVLGPGTPAADVPSPAAPVPGTDPALAGTPESQAAISTITPLREAIERAIADGVSAAERNAVGVAVVSPGGAELGGFNADAIGYAASTYKLAILYEAERQVSLGLRDYGDRVTITEEARAEDLGTLDRLPVREDGTVSLGEALHAMVTFSDNASAVALLRMLGPASIDATLRGLGLSVMSVNDPALPVSAPDLALLAAAIARGEALAPAQHRHALDLLGAQEIRAGIPAALRDAPGVITVANKTGTWPGVTRDVAIVETVSGSYVIAILVPGDWNWSLVRSIARAVHEVLTSP